MKKILLILVAGFFAFSNGFAQDEEVNPNAGEFKFETEEFEFGEIVQGDKVEHEFKFTNIGKEPIIISSARGSCGCTVPTYSKEPVLPGQEGVIKVVFNSTGKMGAQKKSVTLSSNAKSPTKTIYLKGNVTKPVDQGAPLKNSEGPTEGDKN